MSNSTPHDETAPSPGISEQRRDASVAGDGRVDVVRVGRSHLRQRWLLGVVVMLFAAEICARVVVANVPAEIRWYDAAAQLRIEMMDDTDSARDVVFAGPSSAWQALVPERFTSTDREGRSAFNVGLNGGVPTVMGPWLVDEVVPRLDPDLVIWGLTPLDLAVGYGAQQEDAYADAVETRAGWLAALDRAAAQVSTLVRSRRVLRDPSAMFGDAANEREIDLSEVAAFTGADGERLDFRSDLTAEREAVMRSRLVDYAIDDADRTAVIDTIAWLEQRGIEVVLVDMPMPERFRELLPDRAVNLAGYDAAIAAIAEEAGVDVIKMPRALSDSSFVDYTHVDESAATAVTDLVLLGLTALSVADRSGCSDLGLLDDFGFPIPVVACKAT